MNNSRGRSLANVITVTAPAPCADAANVDQYEGSIDREHHDNPHHGTAEERHHQGDRVCQYVHDAGNRAECREKIKHAGEESDVAPKRHFDIRVKTAGQRNATAGDRETCDEQDHGNRTADKCEWRRGSQSLRNRRWDHENSSTNCRADDIRGESWNSNAANQLMINALGLFEGAR